LQGFQAVWVVVQMSGGRVEVYWAEGLMLCLLRILDGKKTSRLFVGLPMIVIEAAGGWGVGD